ALAFSLEERGHPGASLRKCAIMRVRAAVSGRVLWLIIGYAAASCAGRGWPDVVDPRDLAVSGSAPEIEHVRDLGNPDLPRSGPIVGADPDGIATPGELVLLEGSGFGKQPSIHICGRPAAVLSRT